MVNNSLAFTGNNEKDVKRGMFFDAGEQSGVRLSHIGDVKTAFTVT